MKRSIWILWVAAFCFSNAFADITFNDGLHHVIDYTITDTVYVLPTDGDYWPTTLDLVAGGDIKDVLYVQGNCDVGVFGGRLDGGLWMIGDSTGLLVGNDSLNYINLQGDASLTIAADDIALDGTAMYGAMINDGGKNTYEVSGMYWNNVPFVITVGMMDNSSLILTPEPTTVLLVGVGWFFVKKFD